MCPTEAATNESGNYNVTHLIPDVYTIRIQAQGFKVLEFKELRSRRTPGRAWMASFNSASSETVEVTSEAPQLKTDRADVATEFTGRQLQELPIFNRNFQSMELLTPGTQILRDGATLPPKIPRAASRSS